MPTRRASLRYLLPPLLGLAGLAGMVMAPGNAAAQLISIRTVPVSQAHQFDFLPSRGLAMGGVSIAVADSLLDPFSNPAIGTREGTSRFFSSPGVYSVTSQAGSGRTLPVGALLGTGTWHAAVALGLQSVDPSDQAVFNRPTILGCPTCRTAGLDPTRTPRSQGNEYVLASLGRSLPGGVSIGAAVQWSGLEAVDGVDLLYAGSARIQQYGSDLDIRMGGLKEWEGEQSLEVVAVFNRYRMTHDVFYVDPFWDPSTQQVLQQPRLEQNLDRTTTWGVHAEYEIPLATEGWRLGWLGTFNYKTHPKIPNYEIMNIPRDPGFSRAYNLGMGIGRTLGRSVVGLDVIYEPIWSHTWADSESPVQTVQGEIIEPGGKTIENRFRFDNARIHMGVADELDLDGESAIGLQFGVAVRSVSYRLDQTDHVQLTDRTLEEQWTEWMPTWGFSLTRPTFEIRYRGQVTHGTGRPGVGRFGGGCFDNFCLEGDLAVAAGGGILAAPSGPLTLDPVRVFMHQLSFSVPMSCCGLTGGRND